MKTGGALVVANAHAGSATAELAQDVRLRCARALGAATLAWTEAAGSAVKRIEQAARSDASPSVVAVVGGDGTVREVAEGVARAGGAWNGDAADGGPELIVVPAGTGNSAFRALWGERELDDALEAALTPGAHAVRRIDLCRIAETGNATVLGLNVGLVARITALLREHAHLEGLERYGAAIGQAMQELAPFRGRVTVDGSVLHEGPVTIATVGGVKKFGRGTFELLPRSELDDGLLDVCVVCDVNAETFGEVGMLIPTGAHLDHPEVRYAQGRRVVVERTDGEPLVAEHDGDPREVGAVASVEVVPGAVAVRAAP